MHTPTLLRALFSLPGFVAASRLLGVFGDRYARVLVLRRRKKTAICSHCGHRCRGRYDTCTCRARDLSAGGLRISVQFERFLVHCPRCRNVFVERLDWLAKKPRFTQRFAIHVGALCHEMTHTAMAQAERLHDSTVKDLDRIYLQQQAPCVRAIRPGGSTCGRTDTG